MNTPTINWTAEPAVVVLDGSEDYFKKELVEEAKQRFSEREQSFLWAGLDSDHIIRDRLYEGSFFATEKLIVVQDANKVSDSALLEGYCEQPVDGTTLVLVASSGRKPKWFRSLKHNEKVRCDSPKPWEYKDWVVEYCRANGYSIDPRYAESIHANVGDDLFALANELDKVFLNMEEGLTSIQPVHITSVLHQHQTVSPVKVLNAWAQRRRKAALRMAAIYFYQSPDSHAFLPLYSMFMNRIEQMIQFKSLKQSQFSQGDIQSHMGISKYVHDELHRETFQWSLVELREAYTALCDLELMSRKGTDGSLSFQWFLSQHTEE